MATLTFCTTAIFDHGALAQLGAALKSNGISRPLICTDMGLVRAGIVDRVRGALSNELALTIFHDTPENPTEEAVLAAAGVYREAGCDGIVAVGGGSSMDLGKAVALAVTHEGNLIDFTAGRGGAQKIGAVAPLIAVPTTAGTGSEVSTGAVVIMSNGKKLILASKHLVPRIAICDPDLTLGLPPLLTAATGMDAVVHCIEAVCSRQVNPPADAVGLDGIRRALGQGFLERAVADGADKDARWNMMMASTEGAMAFTKGLGAVHSMSHACGALPGLRLHHGTLNAVCLPTVLRFNHAQIGPALERIATSMGLPGGADVSEEITALNIRLGLPANLGAMGVTGDMIDYLAEHAARDVCTFTNPRAANSDDYVRLFEEAVAG
ncbi:MULTISPECIES: iron-containing alcohol dehydrogenase [Alphaproteobacteria]|uniref:iron-containing alcohol dehydrogenase n=1 Tax=Alphaproteobacteria TaxID=28211 RepID=UPI002731146A|nr:MULTISPECIES: iron-containing alcohol dehydrogenase [Alphaproteobacteria]MDP1626773.1 iron-containing alcohol dehydrogenase [Parvibaculum sp.]MDP2213799.1 iron-containing alcohol dehydrogenase [Phenylobacterium sp.]MDP3329764.1 iron-containing alcohol dehydrogenase [Parvibaculum sp.]